MDTIAAAPARANTASALAPLSGLSVLSVLTIPALTDNYIWLIHDGQHAVVVDPGDATPVLAALASHQLTLTAILLTHHHGDHIGGVGELLQHFAVPVYGPRKEAITVTTIAVGQGDTVKLEQPDLRLLVLDVPGHTKGHIAYVRAALDGAAPWLFCGDTLFAGGCGRLFEGTPAQMVGSLGRLAALPATTEVYCAHEYTVANLRFALAVDPGNHALAQRMTAETAKREDGLPTVPSNLGLEKVTNPFLRFTDPAIERSLVAAGKLASGASPVETFAALRLWKNNF